MKIYDITRELLSAEVYPGDPQPSVEPFFSMAAGDECNVSVCRFGSHSGTHVDAPRHYYEEGETIDQLSISRMIGPCSVITVQGIITGQDMERLIEKCEKRILFHGEQRAFLSQSAAFVLSSSEVMLVGTDALSIGPPSDVIRPHKQLLGAGIPVLEGLKLTGIRDGRYLLSALPLKVAGLDASPVRAVLVE